MLKKMSIKKIIVSTTAIILLLVIYLIPSNRKDIDLKNNSIEYNYNNVESTIYLVDSNDYVARTTIPTCKCEGVDLAKDLLEGLVILLKNLLLRYFLVNLYLLLLHLVVLYF